MDYSKDIKKFIYSHYFYGGVRQALGVIVPAIILLGVFHQAVLGLAATFGAMCVSIVDQPGPQRHRRNEMFGCAVLGAATALITALASIHPLWLWLAVVALTFGLSLLTVFGRKGGLIGFAGLLMMTMTMHNAFTPQQALVHTAATIVGSLWYIAFSVVATRLLWYRQEQQAIAVCMFACAEYLQAKAGLYDVSLPLDDATRALIVRQAAVTEQQDAARDVVLRELPRSADNDRRRTKMFNLFIDMVDLHERLVAVHTDHALLRRVFGDADLLVFFRDLLNKLASDVEMVGLAVLQNEPAPAQVNVKAELRAIEYEIELLKKSGFADSEPDAYTALITTFRRARNGLKIVERLHRHTDPDAAEEPSALRIDTSLQRFLSRQDFNPARLTSNLTLSSPNFRHALRVTLAVAIGMTVSSEWLVPHHAVHSYWIVLTIAVIMKPGFSISKQRNLHRIYGTLIGCGLVLAVLSFVHHASVLLAIMLLAAVMGNSMVQLYYLGSAAFNTVFVLLAFHFLSPGSLTVVGERLLDTLVGSVIATLCSYVLPYWEYRLIKPQVRGAVAASRAYLQAARQMLSTAVDPEAARRHDDVEYRLARKNVHIAFGNFANTFYRMMLEPKSKQRSVAELNDLVIQTHELAAQISATAPLLASLPSLPPALSKVLDAIGQTLAAAEKGAGDTRDDTEYLRELGKELDGTVNAAASTLDPDAAQALRQLAYQLKQMAKTSRTILRSAALIHLPA
ncbi:FUSC family protein [Pigmentiphaga soli]|uniref:FUSC family protein n=1 Tax=Pigmentiphaga soli TaxID=1007095 RepID=A0ABP8GXJ7_9BURK